jgi:hypothetical protein
MGYASLYILRCTKSDLVTTKTQKKEKKGNFLSNYPPTCPPKNPPLPARPLRSPLIHPNPQIKTAREAAPQFCFFIFNI